MDLGDIMKRPMVAAGIIAIFLSIFVINASKSAILAVFITAAVLLGISLVVKRLRNLLAIFAVSVVILLNALYVLGPINARIGQINSNERVSVSGEIISAYFEDGRAVYTLKTDNANDVLPRNIKLNVYSKFAVFDIGEKVECDMYVKEILPRYKASYFSKGVYLTANVAGVNKVCEQTNLNSILALFRAKVTNVLNKYLSYDVAATVNALTVGDKYYISNEFDRAVKRCGVSHVMVVSGLHLTIVCGTLLKILSSLRLGKRLSALITAVGVFLFMALCGFSMSILRAGITFFIMLASLAFIRRTDPLNSLMIAVSLIICINPFSVGSVAFVLSVASTAGIIILSKPIADFFKMYHFFTIKGVRAIVDAASVTLSALIFTLPLTVYYFGGFSTVAVITNLLIGFPVTVALITATAALLPALLTDYSVIANGMFLITEAVTRYFNFVINYFSRLPFSYVNVNETIFIGVYLAIIAIFGIIKYRKMIYKGGIRLWQSLTSKCSKQT